MDGSNVTFPGDRNRGLQMGSNSGHVHFHNDGSPEASSSRATPSSTVPFRRDPDFVDGDILAEVDQICSKPASRAALVGLGGVGKSQLAIEYSYRIREQNPQTWIFWVHASNVTRFEESYRMIADRIKLPRRDMPTDDIVQLVSNWLCDEANGRWMMILDNADDPTVFSEPRKARGEWKSDAGNLVGEAISLSTSIPQTPNGSVLVTSRSQDAALRLTGRPHDIIQVDPMDAGCALQLFRKKCRSGFDYDDALELLQALDYMPLAISQAAAYISQRAPRTTVTSYLGDLRKSDRSQTNLLKRDVGDLRRACDASNSIITTWQISFEYIRSKKPSAARLLSLMSFFDRQGIPEFLLRRYDDSEDGSNTDLRDNIDTDLEGGDDIKFEDDVFTLTSYSLIKANVKDNHFEMHQLVQFSTRKWLELNGELETWEKKHVAIMLDSFPKKINRKIYQVLFPHAEAVLAYRPREKKFLIDWSEVLHQAGWYALMQGKYLKMEKMIRKALEARQIAQGKEHPHTLTSVKYLASTLHLQGKHEEAEEMSRRALDGREKTLGKEHPDTLSSISDLIPILRSQGKYEAAEEMGRRALDRRQKVLGKEHPDTLESISDLALVLQSQGKFVAAEEMSRRALDRREKILGKEHPDTLMSISYLASVLESQGKYEAAEEMCRRVLDRREKALGKEHPLTMSMISRLALILQSQGKYEEAEEMSRQELDRREKILGQEHPDTLMSISYLASFLRSQGKYEAAEEMCRQTLDKREKALGKEHPHTLSNISQLALILQSQGKYEEAEETNRRALDGFEKAQGKEHPNTLISISYLVLALQSQGKYEAAEEMCRRALDRREKALGKEHPDTLLSISQLALILQSQGKYEGAEEMSQRASDGFKKGLGKEHPITLMSISLLDPVSQHQGKYEEAEETSRRALDGFEKPQGKEHPNTLMSISYLESVLQSHGKYEAAEEMSRRALDRREKALGKEHSYTPLSINFLDPVLQSQGKYEGAEEMSRRALDGFENALGKEHPNTPLSTSLLDPVLQYQGECGEQEYVYFDDGVVERFRGGEVRMLRGGEEERRRGELQSQQKLKEKVKELVLHMMSAESIGKDIVPW